MGYRARRRLRGLLRGPPRVPPFRPAIQPGHLRLDPVRPGRIVGRHPAGSAIAQSVSRPTAGGDRGTARGGSVRWVSPSRRASGPPTPAGGFFWIYAPVRFEDHAMVTIIQERPTRRADHAGRPPGLRPRARVARPEWLGRPEHQLRFAPGSRGVTGATLTYLRRPRPARRPRSRSSRSWPSPSCWAAGTGSSPTGGTACTRATWWSRGRRSPRPTRATSNWGLTEYAARFTYDGQVGYGMFECAVMGPHQQYGFTGWD